MKKKYFRLKETMTAAETKGEKMATTQETAAATLRRLSTIAKVAVAERMTRSSSTGTRPTVATNLLKAATKSDLERTTRR